MAKEVNRRVNVFINGKEVENNIKSIRAAMSHLTNQLAKMDRGSAEYNQTLYKLAKLRAIYDDHTKSIKDATSAISNMSKANKENAESFGEVKNEIEAASKTNREILIVAGAASSALQGAHSAYQKVISSVKEYIEAFSTLDEAMTNVSKYTGLSKNEVEALNEALQKIDTRTPIEKLNALAADAGRLGITSQQAIQDFVEAGDIINVSLGEDLGEDAVKNIGKMAQMFGESDTLGLRGAMIATASAVNSLGQSSSASEPYIMEFTSRLAGVANTAGITQANIMGIASAMDQNMGQVEKSATSVQKVMMDMMSKTEKYAELVGMTSDEFKNLVDSDMNAAFLSVLDALNSISQQGGSALAQTLSDLKLTGSGVQDTLMTLAKNTDQLREAQANATAAYADGKSVLNEYAAANNNAAAELEKQQNQINIAKANLGKELYPIYLKLINATLAFSNKTVSLVKHLKAHSEILILIGALFAKKIKYYTILTSKQIAHTAAKIKDIAVTKAQAIATNLSTIKLAAECIAHDVATKKITIHRAALEMLNIVIKKTPWGLITAGIATVVTGIISLTKHSRESKAEMKEFNKEMLRQTDYARDLFGRLERLQKGTEEYNRVQKEILDTYPDILKDQVDELGNIKNLKKAYDQVVASIQNKIALERADAERGEITDKYLDKTIKKFEKFDKELKGMNEATKQAVNQRIEQLAKAGKNGEEILQSINNEFGTNLKKTTGNNKSNALFYIEKIVDQTKKMKKEMQAVDDKYAPFMSNTVQGAQEAESELDKMNKKLRQLESQRNAAESSDDKKNIQKQIDLLKEQIRLKKEAKKTDENGTNTNTGGGHTSSSSTKYTVADFDKELAAFRKRQQDATLGEWERTKNGIIEGYDELIKKAKSLGKDDAFLTALGIERDDAVTAAGQKYLQKYTLMLTNMKQETEKLLAENGDDEVSELQKAVIGTEKQWDDKISVLKTNMATIADILQQLPDDDPVRTQMTNIYDGMMDDLTKLTAGKAQATSNVIKKYAKQTSTFIQNERKEMERAQMSELKREKAEINERYQMEIDRITEVIAAKSELVFDGDGDEARILQSENLEDIERLKQELEELIKLRDKLLDNAGKNKKSSKGLWNDLLNIDWSNFKDNWQENLDIMTRALQEFANTALDILNSINQIQANREQAELNQFTATQDAKSEALQRQLDDGLISQKYYNAQMDKMQKEKEAKEKKIQHDQFERERKANLAKVLIEGGLAVATAFAQYGWPWGLIPAALSTAMTAAQTAMIASQVNPYAKGGYIKKEQIALMGEDGQEWVASNKLLTDRKTAPLIAALEDYQRGNSRALEALSLAQPDWNGLSQSAKNISTTFAGSNAPVVNNYNSSTDNSEVLKELKQMNAYLKDPKNRQAYISRKMQLEFDRQENELKAMARL